jgi:hypothetical protein
MRKIISVSFVLLLAAALLYPQDGMIMIRRKAAAASCSGNSASCLGIGPVDSAVNWYYLASAFSASESATICSVELSLRKTGTVTGTYKVGIFSDDAGAPGTLVGDWSDNYNRDDVTSSFTYYTATKASGGLGAALTNATTYWIVFYSSTGSQTDMFPAVDGDCDPIAVAHYSDNGTSWSDGSAVGMVYKLHK